MGSTVHPLESPRRTSRDGGSKFRQVRREAPLGYPFIANCRDSGGKAQGGGGYGVGGVARVVLNVHLRSAEGMAVDVCLGMDEVRRSRAHPGRRRGTALGPHRRLVCRDDDHRDDLGVFGGLSGQPVLQLHIGPGPSHRVPVSRGADGAGAVGRGRVRGNSDWGVDRVELTTRAI